LLGNREGRDVGKIVGTGKKVVLGNIASGRAGKFIIGGKIWGWVGNFNFESICYDAGIMCFSGKWAGICRSYFQNWRRTIFVYGGTVSGARRFRNRETFVGIVIGRKFSGGSNSDGRNGVIGGGSFVGGSGAGRWCICRKIRAGRDHIDRNRDGAGNYVIGGKCRFRWKI